MAWQWGKNPPAMQETSLTLGWKDPGGGHGGKPPRFLPENPMEEEHVVGLQYIGAEKSQTCSCYTHTYYILGTILSA